MLIDEEGVSNVPGLIYGIQKHISFSILPVRKRDIITLFRLVQPKATHDQNAFIIVDRSYYCLFFSISCCAYECREIRKEQK